MSRLTSRLWATTSSQLPTLSKRAAAPLHFTRAFSRTSPRPAGSLLDNLREGRAAKANTGFDDADRLLVTSDIFKRSQNQPTSADAAAADAIDIHGRAAATAREAEYGSRDEPFHFHVLSHRHNTHITVTKPNRGAILSVSAGNLGFRKSKRGSYDAAYQLCSHVIDKLNQGAWNHKIDTLEVVLSGFGMGREAATKVLLGNEGRPLRGKIVKVSDATKLKFGGTRSRNPRRI
ncbi:translational machinery component [Xylariaceae sp. FL0804]|nr:translational machinery component [Xylariaceae sp. FL0804]